MPSQVRAQWSHPSVLDLEILLCEDAQHPLGRPNRLIIAQLRIEHGNLPVVLAVGDQKGNLDLLDLAVESDLVRIGQEIVAIVEPEHPHDMVPIMRHGVLAIIGDSLALPASPNMVGAHYRAQGIARIVRGDPRRMVAAEGQAEDPNLGGDDIGARQQIIESRRSPMLGIIDRGQVAAADRLARSRLIDEQDVDAALEIGRTLTAEVDAFFGRIQAVDDTNLGRGTPEPSWTKSAG